MRDMQILFKMMLAQILSCAIDENQFSVRQECDILSRCLEATHKE
jgi:hypothetical protein